ncbi:MAG TPA: hypothetical protein PKA37_16535, partial [Planctomycetota bacterium]|nr:hypothetical protein [Planctomycetota bacterium]
MNKVKTCLWITLLTAMATGQQPALLNRIVATVYDSNAGIGKIVFTDTETGDMVKYDLPPNFRPGYLVAMDKRGDVWLDDYDTWMLRKFSAVDGSVLATALPSRRVSYMVTDQNGSLVVGSRNLLTGLQAAVYIDRFTSDGAYIDGVDLTTLFPPGVMIPARLAAATANAPQVSFDGIPRILITKSGAIWVGVLRSAYTPVIRLTPALKLDVSFAIYQPWAMVP